MPNLVLSRKAGESLAIGADIVVEVVAVANGRTMLSIRAPSDVLILRSEIVARLVAGEKIKHIRDDLDWRQNQEGARGDAAPRVDAEDKANQQDA